MAGCGAAHSSSTYPIENCAYEYQGGKHPLTEPVPDGTVRVLITGICATLNHQDSWLIIAVDGGPAHRSARYEDLVIPQHRPWLLVRNDDLAPGSREPDFRIESVEGKDKYGLFILERERLLFDIREAFNPEPSAPDPEAVRLDQVCKHAQIARRNATIHPGPRVGAQLKLPPLRLVQAAQTPLEFAFKPYCGRDGASEPRRLSHIGRVDIPKADSPFFFRSHPFDDVPPQSPISFMPKSEGCVVAFGNTPIGGVQQWIRVTDAKVAHQGPDVHFELYYELLSQKPPHDLAIPFGLLAEEEELAEAEPPLPRVGNCPYVLAELSDEW